MKSARKRDRASRMARPLDLLDPATFVPFMVTYLVMVLACVLYAHSETLASAVVLVLVLAVGVVRIRLVPRHELFWSLELVVLWLAHGFQLFRHYDLSSLTSIAASSVAGLVVMASGFRKVKRLEKVRKALGVLVFAVLLFVPGSGDGTGWMWYVSKVTAFCAVWMLVEYESRYMNVPSGDTYTRSVERKCVYAGWLLWAHWIVALVGVIAQGAYLITLIRQQRRQLRRKEDGTADISLISEATRNEERDGVAKMVTQYEDEDEFQDLEGGGEYDSSEIASSSDEEEEEEKKETVAPLVTQGDASSSDWDTSSNPETGYLVSTLPPGAKIPAGAIPILSNQLPQLLEGTSAMRISGGSARGQAPAPFSSKYSRRPPSRLGDQTRRGSGF